MALRRLWGEQCTRCGAGDAFTFHDDGSVRSVVRHACTKPVPGPPDPPKLFPAGEQWACLAHVPKPRTAMEQVAAADADGTSSSWVGKIRGAMPDFPEPQPASVGDEVERQRHYATRWKKLAKLAFRIWTIRRVRASDDPIADQLLSQDYEVRDGKWRLTLRMKGPRMVAHVADAMLEMLDAESAANCLEMVLTGSKHGRAIVEIRREHSKRMAELRDEALTEAGRATLALQDAQAEIVRLRAQVEQLRTAPTEPAPKLMTGAEFVDECAAMNGGRGLNFDDNVLTELGIIPSRDTDPGRPSR